MTRYITLTQKVLYLHLKHIKTNKMKRTHKTCLQQTDLWKAIEIIQKLIELDYKGVPCVIVEGNKWEAYSFNLDLDGPYFGLCSLFDDITMHYKTRHNRFFNSFGTKPKRYWFDIDTKEGLQQRLDKCWEILEYMEEHNINPPKNK